MQITKICWAKCFLILFCLVLLSSGSKFQKQSKHGETQNNITFSPIIASATFKAVLLQLNGMLMMWKFSRQCKTMPSGLPSALTPKLANEIPSGANGETSSHSDKPWRSWLM